MVSHKAPRPTFSFLGLLIIVTAMAGIGLLGVFFVNSYAADNEFEKAAYTQNLN